MYGGAVGDRGATTIKTNAFRALDRAASGCVAHSNLDLLVCWRNETGQEVTSLNLGD